MAALQLLVEARHLQGGGTEARPTPPSPWHHPHRHGIAPLAMAPSPSPLQWPPCAGRGSAPPVAPPASSASPAPAPAPAAATPAPPTPSAAARSPPAQPLLPRARLRHTRSRAGAAVPACPRHPARRRSGPAAPLVHRTAPAQHPRASACMQGRWGGASSPQERMARAAAATRCAICRNTLTMVAAGAGRGSSSSHSSLLRACSSSVACSTMHCLSAMARCSSSTERPKSSAARAVGCTMGGMHARTWIPAGTPWAASRLRRAWIACTAATSAGGAPPPRCAVLQLWVLPRLSRRPPCSSPGSAAELR